MEDVDFEETAQGTTPVADGSQGRGYFHEAVFPLPSVPNFATGSRERIISESPDSAKSEHIELRFISTLDCIGQASE